VIKPFLPFAIRILKFYVTGGWQLTGFFTAEATAAGNHFVHAAAFQWVRRMKYGANKVNTALCSASEPARQNYRRQHRSSDVVSVGAVLKSWRAAARPGWPMPA
jgi:hypothetical protein